MTADPAELAELLATAAGVLDAASAQFIAGIGADSAVAKRGNDFATDVDLAIERRVVAELTRLTGIGVHGEEFGGEPLDAERVWVVDPIDGTLNYAAGSPIAAMLLGLLVDGEPVLGLTWLPFLGQRYTAMVGAPVLCNGEPLQALGPAE
ncbi:MAG: inositol monophosphatase family protein, partial [Actinomycetota bacterium]|nr:inositol monophosphatase family protein [Actinomycetota bacterium]